jgi:hypothetical protein
MSNKITIELCEEDRKRLDSLFLIVAEVVAELKSRGVPVCHELETVATQEAPEQPAPVNEHPADEVSPHGEPEPVAEPEQPKYTKADILAKVQKLAGPNNPKREQAKAIVKSYGAKVSDIPEDKYAEVMEKLTELEG